MLSRQEELKERARVLLEQARKDAALKAGNRQFSSSIVPGRSKQLTDVRNVHYCDLYRSVFAFTCVSGYGDVFLVSNTVAGCNTPEQQNMEKTAENYLGVILAILRMLSIVLLLPRADYFPTD